MGESGLGHRGGRWLRKVAVGGAVLGLTQLALICGPSGPDICSSDRFNCDDNNSAEFVQRTDCPSGLPPLTLELGTGYDVFTPFDPSPEPPLERGGQGGRHLTTSYRVGGADLAASPLLRVTLRMVQPGSACGGDLASQGDAFGDASDSASPDDAGGEACEDLVGQRLIVRGGSRFPLRPAADGVITETGILVIVDWWGPMTFPFRLVGTVEDQCGRVVTEEVSFPGYGG